VRSIIYEVKKRFILVRIKGNNISNLIFLLTKLNIEIKNITYINERQITAKILVKDYKRIKKDFKKNYTFRKIKETGLYSIRPFLKRNKIILLAIIFGIALLFTLSRVIINVDVIHSKKSIRDLVKSELESHGIKRLSFKKNYNTIQRIKREVLEKYPDQLEWIEIEVRGMNYTVRIEERIITEEKEETKDCHIVATKDAIITRIVAYEGETIKRIDDFVRKEDIIISGNITLNESVKNSVCAKGRVYGEAWYTVTVAVPLNYEEKIETGKRRFNILFETSRGRNIIFRPRFDALQTSERKIFNLFGLSLYLQTEKEVTVIPKVYKESEAIEKGIEIAREKLQMRLDKEATILTQKVLKKALNNSTMNLEIFFAVNELISKEVEFVFVPPVEETE